MTGLLHNLLYGNDAMDTVRAFAGLTIGVGGLTAIGHSVDGPLANSVAPQAAPVPTGPAIIEHPSPSYGGDA